MSLTTTTRITLADMDADPARWANFELIEGEPFEMGLTSNHHGLIVMELHGLLRDWMKQQNITGFVTGGETEFRLPDHGRYGVDLAWTDNRELGLQRRNTSAWPLMVEVLSESNTYQNILAKTRAYFQFGAKEVWLIDPDAQTWTVYQPDMSSRQINTSHQPGDWMPGLTLDRAEIFAPLAKL